MLLSMARSSLPRPGSCLRAQPRCPFACPAPSPVLGMVGGAPHAGWDAGHGRISHLVPGLDAVLCAHHGGPSQGHGPALVAEDCGERRRRSMSRWRVPGGASAVGCWGQSSSDEAGIPALEFGTSGQRSTRRKLFGLPPALDRPHARRS
ncbi:hypothetical protein PR202_ga12656 [Eleusine coracana subsp. coracana]|uniref:Uncharacterized protein n=1 Tax=Eleusine coracana subsp. coracana TaxID=191504 RepID=A0AAV5CCB7_ELECO|nr:hypothetical protein PR202_ga12656 [Eleusine coracana subsp. coracana]